MNTTKARVYEDDYKQLRVWSTGQITIAEVIHALVKSEQNKRLREQYKRVSQNWVQKG